MPVILHQKDEVVWLDPELKDPEKLKPLLKPYPSDEMEMYRVSTIVNSPKNDVPECTLQIFVNREDCNSDLELDY